MKISSQIQSFRLGITNNFLVKLQQGFLLVDTSYSFTYNRFLKELEKSNTAYKIVGNIMVSSDKEELLKELNSKKEVVELRIKTLEKQEKQITLVSFLAYRANDFTLGFEYNYKYNKDFRLHQDQTGISGYGFYQLNEKFELFGRYDFLSSNILQEEETPWNLINDGSSITSGIQYQVVDGIKAALNYRDWVPTAANLDNRSYIYLNFEIRF